MARLLDFVLGHQEIIAKLVNSFEQGKPGQTYLFVGPNGIGKKMTAVGLAQALMCPESRRGCGKMSLLFSSRPWQTRRFKNRRACWNTNKNGAGERNFRIFESEKPQRKSRDHHRSSAKLKSSSSELFAKNFRGTSRRNFFSF